MVDADKLRPETRYLLQRLIDKLGAAVQPGKKQNDAINVLLDAIEHILEFSRTPAESDLEGMRAFAKGQGKKERGERHERMIAAVLAAGARSFSLTHPKKLGADSPVITAYHAAADDLQPQGI